MRVNFKFNLLIMPLNFILNITVNYSKLIDYDSINISIHNSNSIFKYIISTCIYT